MNYSMQLKKELIAGTPHKPCCKQAYLRGLFLNAAQTKTGNIVLSVTSLDARLEMARLYRDLYKKEALMEKNTLLFSSERLLLDLTAGEFTPKCPECAEHFLRGAVIATGTATNPEKGYHLEFLVEDGESAALLHAVLVEKGWPLKSRVRPKGVGMYTKNSTVMEEILTFLGARMSVFALMNASITRDIRNAENRATNCVTRNIVKSVGAATKVLDAIAAIKAAARFEALPKELRETAALREELSSASLFELAKAHNPPLTKSGLNHRLQKLVAFAENLKEMERKGGA